jgi:magnesium transporter
MANEGGGAGRLKTARVLAYSAHYRDGRRVATDLTVDQAADLARQKDGFVWLALRDTTHDELKSVARAFGLGVEGIGEPEAGLARPRLVGYKDRAVLTMRSAHYDETAESLELGEIRLLVGAGYVLTGFRGGPSDPAGAIQRLEELHPDLIAEGPGAVVWAVVDDVVDGYEPVASAIDDGIERLEQRVFASEAGATQATYSLSRETIEFHRTLAMLLDPLESIAQGEFVEIPDKLARFMRDAANHLGRLEQQVLAQRDVLSGILDANLALISVRQNDTVQKISAWAAIIAIPTFFASIWGMNFTHMPELHETWGYPFALGLMIAAVIALYVYFKRVRWL